MVNTLFRFDLGNPHRCGLRLLRDVARISSHRRCAAPLSSSVCAAFLVRGSARIILTLKLVMKAWTFGLLLGHYLDCDLCDSSRFLANLRFCAVRFACAALFAMFFASSRRNFVPSWLSTVLLRDSSRLCAFVALFVRGFAPSRLCVVAALL